MKTARMPHLVGGDEWQGGFRKTQRGFAPLNPLKEIKIFLGSLRGSAPQSKVKPRLVGRELHFRSFLFYHCFYPVSVFSPFIIFIRCK